LRNPNPLLSTFPQSVLCHHLCQAGEELHLATPVATIAMLETGVPLPIPSHISPRLRELLPEFLGTNILALDFIYIYIYMGMFVPRNMGIHMEGIYGDQSLHIISFIYKKNKNGDLMGIPSSR
jgi:hypothetical protein